MRTGTATKKAVEIKFRVAENKEVIHTIAGNVAAEKGDYIITGVKEEIYPCKLNIFKMTYDIRGEMNEPV